MKRLWTITLPGTGRTWETTSDIEAHRFTHSFGADAGFSMNFKWEYTEEIPTVIAKF